MVRVLVIEDEPEILRDVADELRENGYIVDEARDGMEGLSILESNVPEIILCDLQMRPIDGYMFMRALNEKSPQLSNIPVVVMSAFGDTQSREFVVECGAVEYLVKPVDYDELLDVVERYTQQTRNK